MHTIESILATAMTGTMRDAFGRTIRGTRINSGHIDIVCHVISQTEINWYLNGVPKDEATMRRFIEDTWRRVDDGWLGGDGRPVIVT